MSLVVAIKDKERFVFGADKQATTGMSGKDHSAIKIWEVEELPGAIMAGVGSCRASQIIQYGSVIEYNYVMAKGGITTSYIINMMVPAIVSQLRENGICCSILDEEKEATNFMIPNTFLFAYEDQAWMIYNDLSVVEIENYQAIGSGSDVANGALFATPDKNPFERIVTCIDAAAETTLFVDHGVDFLATEYYKEDMLLMEKALGIEQEKKPKKPAAKKKTAEKKSTKKSK